MKSSSIEALETLVAYEEGGIGVVQRGILWIRVELSPTALFTLTRGRLGRRDLYQVDRAEVVATCDLPSDEEVLLSILTCTCP